MAKKECGTAILLAAGYGSRMGEGVAKQYRELCGKPVIWYGLQAFEESDLIDRIVLVVAAGDEDYAWKEIVEKYGFTKVVLVTAGGSERCFSVKKALDAIDGLETGSDREGYVFIHDGARPLLTQKIIKDTYEAALQYKACCAAVSVKDTIKIADENGFAAMTPDRSTLYAVQTPQVFSHELIARAYSLMEEQYDELKKAGVSITDDAMLVETLLHSRVKLVESSYENIKITTPEDMEVAERFIHHRNDR